MDTNKYIQYYNELDSDILWELAKTILPQEKYEQFIERKNQLTYSLIEQQTIDKQQPYYPPEYLLDTIAIAYEDYLKGDILYEEIIDTIQFAKKQLQTQ